MTSKNSYGFNTTNPAPQLKELKMFQEDLFAMVKNIQFRPVHNNFQSELKETIKDIQQHEDIIVKADKTRNLYGATTFALFPFALWSFALVPFALSSHLIYTSFFLYVICSINIFMTVMVQLLFLTFAL